MPAGYKGEPVKITCEIIDRDGNVYESIIDMQAGFSVKGFQEASFAMLKLCESPAVSVNVKAITVVN